MTVDITLPLQEKLVQLLEPFGDLEETIAAALRRYAIDACLERVERAERQIAEYERKYRTDYITFNQRIGTDQTYLNRINQMNPLWEADAIEWAYRTEEVHEWRTRSEQIFRASWRLSSTD